MPYNNGSASANDLRTTALRAVGANAEAPLPAIASAFDFRDQYGGGRFTKTDRAVMLRPFPEYSG